PASTRGQTYGNEAITTQNVTPSSNITDSDFRVRKNRRCSQRPVAAEMTTRPKSVATITSSAARIDNTPPTSDGKTSKQRNTPTVSTIEPKMPIIATRKLVSCNLATARLTVFGIAADRASEMINQKRIASSRTPRKAGVNCGLNKLNGSRIA